MEGLSPHKVQGHKSEFFASAWAPCIDSWDAFKAAMQEDTSDKSDVSVCT